MDGRLAGKRAIVTGGAQGIGRATVERFVAEGANVLAVDIDADALSRLRAELGCEGCVLDLTAKEGVEALAESAGDVDVLFLCAGHVAMGTILECKDEDWTFSFELNVTAMFRMMRAFLPRMIQRRRGAIVTMSSVASSVRGVVNRCAYASTKAAVIGLTKAVAADFVTHGIRCNCICPGTVASPSLEARMRASGDYATTREAYIARQPMGRLGAASEIANLAVYLASDESSFTTGQCHVIDGGWSN